MNTILTTYYDSPYGKMILGTFNEKLCICDWYYRKARQAVDGRVCNYLNAQFMEGPSTCATKTIEQLDAYFADKKKAFDIPLLLCGSDFQQAIWRLLVAIPFGKTITYKDLSIQYGNPLAIRAIAAANGANAISILVPCHRVVGQKGKLVGYAGGLPAKKKLLELETPTKQSTLF